MDLKPGSQIAARYRIERILDEDGGVSLLAAHNLENGALAAVKVFPASIDESQLISRFRRAQEIDSSYVPQLLELGAADGRTFVAMEYLAGSPLSQKVSKGPLPIAEALGVLLKACDAVAAAHRAGLVHRQLRTSKLFEAQVAGGGTDIRVLGFGTGVPARDSKPGELPDDVDYLAPEQLAGVNQGERAADIWALGVILYELLTGKRPFTGLTRKAVAKAVAEEEPKRPRSLRAELPWQVEQAVLRCLDKSATTRIPSAEALAEALKPYAAPGAATPAGAPRSTPPPRPSPTIPPMMPPAEVRVAKLSHLLGSQPPGAAPDPPPTFHRRASDGRIEGMNADDFVGIARAKRVAEEANRIKEDVKRRGSSAAPPPREVMSTAPPSSKAVRSKAPRAPAKRSMSITTIIVILIIVALVLGLGVGALVRVLAS